MDKSRKQQLTNNNNLRAPNKPNTILNSGLNSSFNDRYCRHCHMKLVHNPRNSPYDRYTYSCPQCNCGGGGGGLVNIHNTEPAEKLVTTFPTHNTTTSQQIGRLVTQPENQRVSRSKYFINKNIQKKNEIENEDPYLAILKRNNKITITNVEYYEPNEE
jgi:hypothetical protein